MGSAIFPFSLIAGIFGVLGLVVFGVEARFRSLRRRRWHGDVYPATASVGRRERRFTKRVEVSDEGAVAAAERWGGESFQLQVAWVRASDQRQWHQATAFAVGGGRGIVVDQSASKSRKYVFDETCEIGPLAPGRTLPHDNTKRTMSAVRVSDGSQSIELAVGIVDIERVLGVVPPPPDELVEFGGKLVPVPQPARFTEAPVSVSMRMEARSRGHRGVSALLASACGVGYFLANTGMSSSGQDRTLPDHILNTMAVPLLGGFLTFGYSAVRWKKKRKPSPY